MAAHNSKRNRRQFKSSKNLRKQDLDIYKTNAPIKPKQAFWRFVKDLFQTKIPALKTHWIIAILATISLPFGYIGTIYAGIHSFGDFLIILDRSSKAGLTARETLMRDAILTGIIFQDHMEGPPARNLPVQASIDSATTTNEKGVFVLKIHDGKPGQRVTITTGNSDWLVVNDWELSAHIPDEKSIDQYQVRLVVARPEDVYQRKLDLVGAPISKLTQQSYDQQRARIMAQPISESEKQKQITELTKQFGEFLAQAEKWTNSTATYHPTIDGEIITKALQEYSAGHFDQVSEILSSEKLIQASNSSLSNDKKLDLVRAWELKLRVSIAQFKITEATEQVTQITKLFPSLPEAWLISGNIKLSLNDNHGTLNDYQTALRLALEQSNLQVVAQAQNNLATFLFQAGNTDVAIAYLNSALKIQRTLAKQNGDDAEIDVASTLSNLANFDFIAGRLDIAESRYNEALNIRIKLEKRRPDLKGKVAAIYVKLAKLKREQNRFHQSEIYFDDALKIGKSILQKDKSHQSEYCKTLLEYADLGIQIEKFEKSQDLLLEALQIERSLISTNRTLYLPLLASTLNALGNANTKMQKYQQAKQNLEELAMIYYELIQTQSNEYLPLLAATQQELRHLMEY